MGVHISPVGLALSIFRPKGTVDGVGIDALLSGFCVQDHFARNKDGRLAKDQQCRQKDRQERRWDHTFSASTLGCGRSP